MGALARIETTAPVSRGCLPPDAIEEMQMEVFTSVPSRHLVYAVDDHSCMPLVARGQVLVVKDAPRYFPIKGQWFLMQWISDDAACVQYGRDRVGQTIGIPYENRDGLWGYRPPAARGPGTMYCGDGWWDFGRMVNLIRGPVVGIYAPVGVQ